MALTWDITNVKPHERLAYLGENDPETKKHNGWHEWPTEWKEAASATQACVFSTMAIGIGHWTEENIDEVVYRLDMYHKVTGPMLANNDGPYMVPEEHVRALVGLRTNVPYEPRNAWLIRLWGDRA